jgi:DNA-binding NarL/FixJ family response regulator
MAGIRTLLVDDDESHRALLRLLLEGEPAFRIVGEAADGLEGVAAAALLRPGLIVSDIEMPRLDGLAAAAQYRAAAPQAVIVLMSSMYGSTVVRDALAAGADVYVDKGAGVGTIIDVLLVAAREAAKRASECGPGVTGSEPPDLGP